MVRLLRLGEATGAVSLLEQPTLRRHVIISSYGIFSRPGLPLYGGGPETGRRSFNLGEKMWWKSDSVYRLTQVLRSCSVSNKAHILVSEWLLPLFFLFS